MNVIKERLARYVARYRRFKVFLSWLPIIWQDRDWDWEYILSILQFKIIKVRDHTKECGNHVNDPKYIKEMNKAIKMIDEVISENPLEKEFANYYKKYGHPKQILVPTKEKTSVMYNCKYISEKARLEYMNLLHEEMEAIQKNWNDLFDYLKDHMKNWWN